MMMTNSQKWPAPGPRTARVRSVIRLLDRTEGTAGTEDSRHDAVTTACLAGSGLLAGQVQNRSLFGATLGTFGWFDFLHHSTTDCPGYCQRTQKSVFPAPVSCRESGEACPDGCTPFACRCCSYLAVRSMIIRQCEGCRLKRAERNAGIEDSLRCAMADDAAGVRSVQRSPCKYCR